MSLQKFNPTISHVCPHCARLHEVVPTCHSCDQHIQARRNWHEMGVDQGRREQHFEDIAKIESLRSRILELEGALIRANHGWNK